MRDLSRKQAANELGISEGQLSRRTQAALGKLRAQIELVSSGQPIPRAHLLSAANARNPPRSPGSAGRMPS